MPLMRQKYIRTFITSSNNQLPSGPISNHDPDNCPPKNNPLLNKKQSKLSSSHNLLMRKSLLTHKITKPNIIDEKHNSYERYLNRNLKPSHS